MLTLLIPGPKQPRNDIDVFLQPLIDDLKVLWNNSMGIYDSFSKSHFNLRAILMLTVNDFPAYGNLAGRKVKGNATCPMCGVDTCSRWLPFSKKAVYMCTRRFLSPKHLYRKKKSCFDDTGEKRGKPKILTGGSVAAELKKN